MLRVGGGVALLSLSVVLVFFKTSQIYQREFRSLEHYKHQGTYKPSTLKGPTGAPKVPQSYLKGFGGLVVCVGVYLWYRKICVGVEK